jgi:hypothetical protein
MNTEQVFRLISPIITLVIGTIIKYYTEEKSKLITYVSHISSFTLNDEQKTKVFAHSIIVRNNGRKTAKNIRICHKTFPENIQVFPPVQYSIEKANQEGAYEIVMPTIVPKEQVTISYLYFPPTTWDQINSYTKSDDGLAKVLNIVPMRKPNRLVISILLLLTFIGASYLTYWIFRLIEYLLQL